jgi:hypothetical protein
VEDIFKQSYRNLNPPSLIGSIPQENMRIRVLNGTGDKVIYYFSGKKSRTIPLEPYESQNVDFPAGAYRIAVVGLMSGSAPACLIFDFKSGIRYSLIEEGVALASTVKTEKPLSQKEIRIKYEIPELEIPDQATTKTEEKRGHEDRPRDGTQPRMPR